MVTVGAGSENQEEERIKKAFFIVEPNQQQLMEVGKLLDAGTIRTFVASVIPLFQAPDAFTGKLVRRGRGKIVVEVLPESTPPK